LLARTILNEKILLYKGADNAVVAMEDRCCHRGAALSQGRLEGNCVRCMYHGLLFDKTGACVEIPGQESIPPSLKVRSYPVETVGRLVWIWMGDKALANKADIPEFEYLTNPEWHGMPGYMHYKSNYQLITDNLADINHIAYVHTNTLGGSENYTPSRRKRRWSGWKMAQADQIPFEQRLAAIRAQVRQAYAEGGPLEYGEDAGAGILLSGVGLFTGWQRHRKGQSRRLDLVPQFPGHDAGK